MLHGCKIADHGFEKFPSVYAEEAEAEHIFAKEEKTPLEREALFGYLLVQCMKMYARHNILVQLHFAVTRNVNKKMYLSAGADSGFDVIGPAANTQDLIAFFSHLADEERPETVLYTLNDSNLPALCCVTGAFRKVRMGAAWWFNDTAEGIRRNLKTIAEYSALGNNFGMLTDSRSFASYVRFDFFRRILADYLGGPCRKRGVRPFRRQKRSQKRSPTITSRKCLHYENDFPLVRGKGQHPSQVQYGRSRICTGSSRRYTTYPSAKYGDCRNPASQRPLRKRGPRDGGDRERTRSRGTSSSADPRATR